MEDRIVKLEKQVSNLNKRLKSQNEFIRWVQSELLDTKNILSSNLSIVSKQLSFGQPSKKQDKILVKEVLDELQETKDLWP